jgi:hypothetical protein
VHEYPDYFKIVDENLDVHNPDMVNPIYKVQDFNASPTPHKILRFSDLSLHGPHPTLSSVLSLSLNSMPEEESLIY